MPVGLNNFTASDIRNEVIGTGGSVAGSNYSFSDLRNNTDFAKVDDNYKDGATSNTNMTKAGQWRNYPTSGGGGGPWVPPELPVPEFTVTRVEGYTGRYQFTFTNLTAYVTYVEVILHDGYSTVHYNNTSFVQINKETYSTSSISFRYRNAANDASGPAYYTIAEKFLYNTPYREAPTITADKTNICGTSYPILHSSCRTGGTLTWSNGMPGYPIVATTPGTYYARCITSNAWEYSEMSNTIIIFTDCSGGGTTSPPSPPSITANTTSVCGTQKATLTASGCSGGIINWSNGMSGTMIEVGAGTYTATCTVGSLTSSASSSITVVSTGTGPETPIIETNKLSICGDEKAILTGSCRNGATLVWSNGATGTPLPFGLGNHYAFCRNSCGDSPISNVITITENFDCAVVLPVPSYSVNKGVGVYVDTVNQQRRWASNVTSYNYNFVNRPANATLIIEVIDKNGIPNSSEYTFPSNSNSNLHLYNEEPQREVIISFKYKLGSVIGSPSGYIIDRFYMMEKTASFQVVLSQSGGNRYVHFTAITGLNSTTNMGCCVTYYGSGGTEYQTFQISPLINWQIPSHWTSDFEVSLMDGDVNSWKMTLPQLVMLP